MKCWTTYWSQKQNQKPTYVNSHIADCTGAEMDINMHTHASRQSGAPEMLWSNWEVDFQASGLHACVCVTPWSVGDKWWERWCSYSSTTVYILCQGVWVSGVWNQCSRGSSCPFVGFVHTNYYLIVSVHARDDMYTHACLISRHTSKSQSVLMP